MGDRCYLNFYVRGHIATMEQLEKIIDAIDAEGMVSETDYNGPNGYGRYPNGNKGGLLEEFVQSIIQNVTPGFVEEECNYANIEGLEAVMQELDVAYHVNHGSGSEYPAGCWSWSKELGRHEAQQGQECGTVLELSAVKACMDDPVALKKLIVEAEHAEGVGLPVFTVGEEVRLHFAPLIAKQALGVA